MSEYAEVVQALEYLLEFGPVLPNCGVCWNVVELLGEGGAHSPEWFDLIRKDDYAMYNTWPHYTGARTFPIPGGEGMYDTCSKYSTLWDGEQGALRYDFIRHCIAFIEQQYPA